MQGPQGHARSHLILRRLHSEQDSVLPFGGSDRAIAAIAGEIGVRSRLLALLGECVAEEWKDMVESLYYSQEDAVCTDCLAGRRIKDAVKSTGRAPSSSVNKAQAKWIGNLVDGGMR